MCPLKYYYSRVLKLPAPATPSLHLGKAVHAGIEEANRLQFRGRKVLRDEVLHAFHQAYDELQEADPVEWKGEDQPAKLRETGERVLVAYLDSDVSTSPDPPLGVEVQLSMDVDELDLRLVGFVDRVNRDGTAVDYKTVAASPSVKNEIWLHQLQLAAYHVLIEEATGVDCPGAELVFLVKTKTPKVVRAPVPPPEERERARFWSLLRIVAEGIRAHRFHPQPGMHCSWCPYRDQCAKWSGKGEAA